MPKNTAEVQAIVRLCNKHKVVFRPICTGWSGVFVPGTLLVDLRRMNKIIEIKPVSINKGQAAQLWLEQNDRPFIFCAGDDYTDEDMFSVLPDFAVSCKVGTGPSKAKFRVSSPNELRDFLSQLITG